MIRCALAEILQAADVDAAALEPLDLVEQHLRVDHDAVADRAGQARVEDPRRDQVELELLAVAHDRVAGVVAALKADHEVGLLGEQVGDLALAFVAPLGAHYDYSWHRADKCRGGSVLSLWPRAPGRRRCAGPRRTAAAGRRDLDQARDRALADLLLELVDGEVGRDEDRALLLVALVDQRVELLQHPVGLLLGAEVLEVEQVDRDERWKKSM